MEQINFLEKSQTTPKSENEEDKIYNFKIDEAGVFISLTTTPFNNEKKFLTRLEGILKKYKENIKITNEKLGYGSKDVDFDDYFYEPKAYFLWGTFDLALISLVDDFSLGARDFHPHSNSFDYEPSSELNVFDYQTMTTAHSYPVKTQNSKIASDFTTLYGLWGNYFSEKKQEKKAYEKSNTDFIGICTFKINNGLLLGVGSIVVDLIKLKLGDHLNSILKRDGDNGSFLILDSFSWYELVILIFSNNVDLIAECISTRETTIGELLSWGKDNVSEINGISFKEIEESIYDKSVLANIGYEGKKENLVNSHVFVHTYSTLGFDFGLVANESEKPMIKSHFRESEIRLVPRYTIKPGHYLNAKDLLLNVPLEDKKKFDVNLLFGDGDAFINISSTKEKNSIENTVVNEHRPHSLSLEEYLLSYRSFQPDTNNMLKRHVRKIKTLVYFKDGDLSGQPFDIEKHADPYLNQFIYPTPKIKDVRDQLYRLRISKVVRERVIRMFSTYNDSIQDPVMYSYFIDFQPLLDRVILTIKNYIDHIEKPIDYDIDELHETLLTIADVFEHAHTNRYQQNYKLNEFPDHNMDFNGGVHQIVSAMDTIYKSVHSKLLGSNKDNLRTLDPSVYAEERKKLQELPIIDYPIVYVSGYPGVKSNGYSLRLNYFHVFEPTIFMAEIVKEASNYILEASDKMPTNTGDGEPFDERRKKILDSIKKAVGFSPEALYLEYIFKKDGLMLRYWMSDAISFYFTYFLNDELYRFWFWHIALQTSTSYDKNGNISEEVFVKLLIRYLMLMDFCGNSEKEKGETAPSVKLQNLWNKHFDTVSELVKTLFRINDVNDFYNHKIAETIHFRLTQMRKPDRTGDTILSDRLIDIFNNLTDKKSRNCEIGTSINLEKWNQYAKYLKSILLKQPEHYFPESSNNGHSESDFQKQSYSILALFNAHLDNVLDLFDDSYDNSLLDRIFESDQGRVANVASEGLFTKVPMKFDVLGGLFNVGYSDKRDVFKKRVGVIKAMIDFSLKNKPKFFSFTKS